jgi:hypothetical protein
MKENIFYKFKFFSSSGTSSVLPTFPEFLLGLLNFSASLLPFFQSSGENERKYFL